jgi:hypothetical protein
MHSMRDTNQGDDGNGMPSFSALINLSGDDQVATEANVVYMETGLDTEVNE